LAARAFSSIALLRKFRNLSARAVLSLLHAMTKPFLIVIVLQYPQSTYHLAAKVIKEKSRVAFAQRPHFFATSP
jgi:hypothetical protein